MPRLQQLGPHSLTDAELARWVFGKCAPEQLSVLRRCYLNQRWDAPVPGVNPVALRRVQAWQHLARRWTQQHLQARPLLADTPSAARYLVQTLAHRPVETVLVLMLDAQLRLCHTHELTEGSVREARVYPREVVRAALESGATSVVLAHNHPSGNAEPSAADHALTERLEQALTPLEVGLLDHFVVTRSWVTSIKFGTSTATGLELCSY
ncbi:MAG: JAB domain-containing protein [Litorivicinus sp.]